MFCAHIIISPTPVPFKDKWIQISSQSIDNQLIFAK